jgi:hypothetical protein
VVFAFVPLMEAQFASQIRLTLRHILAFTKGVKSKLIARWEWHQLLRKLFSGMKKGGFCHHLRGFFFFIHHLEKLV